MRTTEILQASLLAAAFLAGCTNLEAPVVADSGEAIRITAGIGQTTRTVIDAGYAENMDVSFARIDHSATASDWESPAIEAVRTGGVGKTSITFNPEQNYLSGNVQSALIGYYPRKALGSTTSNPVSVNYTITGGEDIMATEVQTGSGSEIYLTYFSAPAYPAAIQMHWFCRRCHPVDGGYFYKSNECVHRIDPVAG